MSPRALLISLLALGLALLLAARAARSLGTRERWARVLGMVAIAVLLTPGCTLFGWGKQALWENAGVTYFHQAFSPGPTLLTREDGSVLEERRFEPFGEELDAYTELTSGGSQTGPIDYSADSHNILNKQTDPATGWSYHGARWMAPETARWLTPDPPVKAPDPEFMGEPWGLHPYQYVLQNPVLLWDPDGRQPVLREACYGGVCVPVKGATPSPPHPGGEFLRGFVEGAYSGVQGAYELVRHPVRTVEGLYDAATHPWETAKRVGRSVLDAATSGDPRVYGRIVGGLGVGGAATKTLRVVRRARAAGRITARIDGVRIVDQRTGRVVHQGTVDLTPTLDRIRSGGSFPHRNDGSVFKNREGLLPMRPEGYYREFVHPTPGVPGPGPQRIVRGQDGELFYTPDHYETFIPLN